MAKIDLKKARLAQEIISSKIILDDAFKTPIRHIGGVDVSFLKSRMIGSAVVLSFPELKVIEQKVVNVEVKVPYIPTFLAFREVPAMIRAIKSLKIKPEIYFIDANGILHPRKAGEASHVGVVLDIPTIGIAKSLLCGKVVGEGRIRKIMLRNEVVGYEVKTNLRPIYVSPGHKVSLKTTLDLTLKVTRYRIPEPIRIAHITATEAKRGMMTSLSGE